MTTELKDVLHLYFGRQCKVQLIPSGITPMMIIDGKLIDDRYLYGWIKPLLRPLESMTEEEKLETTKIIFPKSVGCKINTFGFQIEGWGDGEHNLMDNYSPGVLVHLLSNGFDLFGLIESGQALDISKH